MFHTKQNGFTVTEVIIVLIIIAVLTIVLLPNLQTYMHRSRRSDALKTILHLQVAEEKYRTTNTTYGNLSNLSESTNSSDGYYTMSITSNAASTYTISATATGTQASDTDCTNFTLTFASGATTKTSTPNTDCWSH